MNCLQSVELNCCWSDGSHIWLLCFWELSYLCNKLHNFFYRENYFFTEKLHYWKWLVLKVAGFISFCNGVHACALIHLNQHYKLSFLIWSSKKFLLVRLQCSCFIDFLMLLPSVLTFFYLLLIIFNVEMTVFFPWRRQFIYIELYRQRFDSVHFQNKNDVKLNYFPY